MAALVKFTLYDSVVNVSLSVKNGQNSAIIKEIQRRLTVTNQLREVIEGRMIGKRPRGRKRLGMLNEFLKESSYAEIKRKAEKGKSEEYGSQEPASRQNTNNEPAQDLYIHLDSETRV